MAPASGPVHDPKMFPAAAMEDQEAIAAGEQAASFVTTPPFSSPDPSTDALRMEIVDADVSALDAREGNAPSTKELKDYGSMSPAELKALAEERDLEVKGTGANGNVKKTDLVSALQEDDASEFKAADFKERIAAANTQEELDAAAEFYANSGKEYASVAAAVEKRQEEIDEAASGDGDDS